jgi:ParB-like chromosome segregation protein Spo0J
MTTDPATDIDLETEADLVSVENIVPYGQNPKEHPQEQIDKIASSIKRFGWDQPIVVDGEGTIIKGHGRYQAAQKLGIDRVPVFEQTDLSEAEVRAARIADNRVAESEWDDDLLGVELELLDESELSTEASGMDEGEVEDALPEREPPDFEPTTADGQGELDGKTDVTCPECGHEFHR